MEIEAVAVGNLIDFDVSPCPEGMPGALSGAPAGMDFQQPLLPEPLAPTLGSDGHPDGGDRSNDSEATESADSENEGAESPSHPWGSSRRSSSSSHSTEEGGPEVAECKEFMKAYVEKVFHGR